MTYILTTKIWISNTSNVHLSSITDWDEILPQSYKMQINENKGKRLDHYVCCIKKK